MKAISQLAFKDTHPQKTPWNPNWLCVGGGKNPNGEVFLTTSLGVTAGVPWRNCQNNRVSLSSSCQKQSGRILRANPGVSQQGLKLGQQVLGKQENLGVDITFLQIFRVPY